MSLMVQNATPIAKPLCGSGQANFQALRTGTAIGLEAIAQVQKPKRFQLERENGAILTRMRYRCTNVL